jgi:predicted nucleic acid-binding protein
VSAVVPVLWPLEVANVLVLGERRRRSTVADATRWLRFLQQLPIRVDDLVVARAWTDILQVARSYDLSVYDACYLELALRLGLPLASVDDQLKAAAAAAGVAEFIP